MRLREGWGVIVGVTLLIAVALVLSAWMDARFQRGQLDVTCQSAQSNITQLRTLERISMELGLPPVVTIPRLPAECRGL